MTGRNTMILNHESQLELDFQRFASQWKKETEFQSSTRKDAENPAFKRIIAMGLAAVPLILADLERKPSLWFYALQTLTGENPVPDAFRGDLKKSTEAWLSWGKERGYGV